VTRCFAAEHTLTLGSLFSIFLIVTRRFTTACALDVPCQACGLFIPKPTIVEGYQRHSVLDLGQPVRECPLASAAVGGDCY